jgi:DNA-binding CsgD family transcriptional regulator
VTDLDQRHVYGEIDDDVAASALERGRAAYRMREWTRAYRAFLLADQAEPLSGPDLELLAITGYLIGREDEYLSVLDRAHRAHLDAEESRRAARCAFWIGLHLFFRREVGRASGWFVRAHRLLEREGCECVEHGYLLLPVSYRSFLAGDWNAAFDIAARAAAIGTRFTELDVSVCARHLQGLARMHQGRVAEGLTLLDEAMLAVTAGELASPLMTGLIYISALDGCQQMYLLGRTREWSDALARWCREQPDMIPFIDVCMLFRARVLHLQGAWQEAIDEAQRAADYSARAARRRMAVASCQQETHPLDQGTGTVRGRVAAAFYLQGKIHSARGEFARAEDAYRKASHWGMDPQPGLALLRLARGRVDAASAAIQRALNASTGRLERAGLLPAYIEIMLERDAAADARIASIELDEIARIYNSEILNAIAAQARGAVELAEGDTVAALRSLRLAWLIWQQSGAPYPAARVRVHVALACRVLDDQDGFELEQTAARVVFARIGAAPSLAHLDSLSHNEPGNARMRGLTARELQVLRQVAAGKTNKSIAGDLALSERTVDRHVGNIFDKLGVHSRTAAAAYAYQHRLL